MAFATRVFQVAWLYGLAVLTPQFFLEAQTGRDFPPPITHPEFYYGFVGVAWAWQVAFLLIARDPARYRPLMIPAILEKVAFGGAALALLVAGRVPALVAMFGGIDLVLATLFAAAYRRTADQAVASTK